MGRHAADPGQPFDRLAAPHRAALWAYILRLTEGDEALAASVFKETLYRVAQEPERFARHAPGMRPLLVLTAHKVLNGGERNTPDDHSRAVTATTLASALEDLPAAQRDLIVDLVYRRISLEDAATGRGASVETIKSQLYAALRELRATLDRHAGGRHRPE